MPSSGSIFSKCLLCSMHFLVKMCSIAVIYSQINKEPMEHSWHKKYLHWKFCLDQKLKKISNAAKKLCHRRSIPKISLSCQEKYVEWHKRNSWMEQQRHFFKNVFKNGQILRKYTIFGPTCMHLNRHISETAWNWHLAFCIIAIDTYRPILRNFEQNLRGSLPQCPEFGDS